MTTLSDYNSYGEELEDLLQLKTRPIAVKMLKSKEDIPEEAIRPKKDRDEHLGQCQAFALTRRRGETVAMLKEDHWCWAPLLGYGMVDTPEIFKEGKILHPHLVENLEAAKDMAEEFPQLERGKYIGILSAPLKNTSVEPDLILIYSNNAQLRSILNAVKYKEGDLLTSEFDPLDSCVYSVVPLIQGEEYRITFPDPGEHERAMAGEDEVIFSVNRDKIEELIQGLRHLEEIELGYTDMVRVMRPDYPQPEFYKELFREWGLDVQE